MKVGNQAMPLVPFSGARGDTREANKDFVCPGGDHDFDLRGQRSRRDRIGCVLMLCT
jgi:hypothetical protein